MWKRHVNHLWKTIDSPREEVAVPEIADESQIASPLQSYQDPPAVHSNEGGTLASSSSDSVPVIMKGSETATLLVEEPVTDTAYPRAQ